MLMADDSAADAIAPSRRSTFKAAQKFQQLNLIEIWFDGATLCLSNDQDGSMYTFCFYLFFFNISSFISVVVVVAVRHSITSSGHL